MSELQEFYLRKLREGTPEERAAVKADPLYLATMYGAGPLTLAEIVRRANY